MSQDLREELQGNSERSQPTETSGDAEAHNDFRSTEGDFIYRHRTEPRVHLYVLKEESFQIPLRYIDGNRSTLRSAPLSSQTQTISGRRRDRLRREFFL